MGTVRTTTLTTRPTELTNVTLTDAAQGQLVGILKDRKTLVFEYFNSVLLSTDYGVTTNFAGSVNDGNWRPTAFVETPGGQVLMAVGRSSFASEVWRSVGWTGTGASSWAKVLTASGPGVEFRGEWALNERTIAPTWSRHAGAIFVAEYGTHVNSATTPAAAAVRVLMSADDGLTWRTVFDVRDRWPSDTRLHVHSCAYDPWTGRLIVSQGDGNSSPAGHCGVWYTDNVEDTTPTWTLVPGSDTVTSYEQVTTIIPAETGIILLPDGRPAGVRVIPRRGLTAYGPLREVAVLSGYNEAFIGHSGYRAGGNQTPTPGAPVLMSVTQPTSPLTNSGYPALMVTTDGVRYRQLYRHGTAVSGTAPGFTHVFGPTVDGKIVALLNLTGGGKIFTADYLPAVTV